MGYYKGIRVQHGESPQQAMDRYQRSKKITKAIWEKYYGPEGIYNSTKKGIVIKETKGGKKEIVKGDDAIQELLKQKEAAKGDKDLSRKIRSKLRKLGYRKEGRKGKKNKEPEEDISQKLTMSTTEMLKRMKKDKRKKKRELKKRKGF